MCVCGCVGIYVYTCVMFVEKRDGRDIRILVLVFVLSVGVLDDDVLFFVFFCIC